MKGSVLIADDEPLARRTLRQYLLDLGCVGPIHEAPDGKTAIAVANSQRPDLVFLDIVMPGAIDGVGLAREIRSRYPNLPVVLTTGYSDAAQAAPSELRILRKPFDTDTLQDFVQNIGK